METIKQTLTSYFLSQLCSVEGLLINLISIRKKFNVSQEEIADELNLSRPAISRIEKGDTKILFSYVHYYSQKFNLSIDEILNFHEKETSGNLKEDSEKYGINVKETELNNLKEEIDSYRFLVAASQNLIEGLQSENKEMKKQLATKV
jgi:transcriptional regulator with XRE-family HTH domain